MSTCGIIILFACAAINALNTFRSNNETLWRSTSDFIPINSSHGGFYQHIVLSQHMNMSFDLEFHRRTSNLSLHKWEQIFRVGLPAYTMGNFGANSRYPSLWIDNTANVFHFSLSHSSDGGWGKDFNSLILQPRAIYSIYIEWNETWVYFSVNGSVLWNEPRNFPTNPQYIGSLLNVYIASDSVPNEEPYIIADVTLRNIIIHSVAITRSPTINRTQMPSISPTNVPTTNPTIIPTNNPTFVPNTFSPTSYPTFVPTSHPIDSPSKYSTIYDITDDATTGFKTSVINVTESIVAEYTTINRQNDETINDNNYVLVYLIVSSCVGCVFCSAMVIICIKNINKPPTLSALPQDSNMPNKKNNGSQSPYVEFADKSPTNFPVVPQKNDKITSIPSLNMEDVAVVDYGHGHKRGRKAPPKHSYGGLGVIHDDKRYEEEEHKTVELVSVDGDHDTEALSHANSNLMEEESVTMLEVGYEWITVALLEIDARNWKMYVSNFKSNGITEECLEDLNDEDFKRLIPDNMESRNAFQKLVANKLGQYRD